MILIKIAGIAIVSAAGFFYGNKLHGKNYLWQRCGQAQNYISPNPLPQ